MPLRCNDGYSSSQNCNWNFTLIFGEIFKQDWQDCTFSIRHQVIKQLRVFRSCLTKSSIFATFAGRWIHERRSQFRFNEICFCATIWNSPSHIVCNEQTPRSDFLWFHCDFKSNFLICELNIDWRALFLSEQMLVNGASFSSIQLKWHNLIFFYRWGTDIHQNRKRWWCLHECVWVMQNAVMIHKGIHNRKPKKKTKNKNGVSYIRINWWKINKYSTPIINVNVFVILNYVRKKEIWVIIPSSSR